MMMMKMMAGATVESVAAAPCLVDCPSSITSPLLVASSFRPSPPPRCLFLNTSILSSRMHFTHHLPITFAKARPRFQTSCSNLRTTCQAGEPDEKAPFGHTRKDVLLIGLGLVVFGVGLKYGLEFFGVDPLKAGNVVQIVMVLGLTVGWISTYIFRVSTKEMTYAKQLKDYENKVMQKRFEELPEAELESLLAQIEEEKRQLKSNREKMSQ